MQSSEGHLAGALLLGFVLPRISVPQGAKTTGEATAPFRVAVTFSDQARAELTRRGESLRIFGYLYAEPNPGVRTHDGEFSVGRFPDLTFPLTATPEFPSVPVNKVLRRQTHGPLQLLLNALSARKSSPDNLLSCDFYQGAAPLAKGTVIPLRCWLISEGNNGHMIDRLPGATTPLP